MQNKYTKIVTHSGTHHADEVLAIAAIFEFIGELPVERKNKAEMEDLENPDVLVLDIGSRLEPEKGNFDHHQNSDIPATNILIINYLCDDEKLKAILHKQLFSSVDAVDRGIFRERGECEYLTPDFNSLIRSLNNIDDGFNKALIISRLILSGAIATAKKNIESEAIWNSLEKRGEIAIHHTFDPIIGWHELAERDGILLLITPNNRIPGSYQVMSRDTNLFIIPSTDEQLFKHVSGFLAVYPNFISAMKHANEMINSYIYTVIHFG